jgi:hypothetical protein
MKKILSFSYEFTMKTILVFTLIVFSLSSVCATPSNGQDARDHQGSGGVPVRSLATQPDELEMDAIRHVNGITPAPSYRDERYLCCCLAPAIALAFGGTILFFLIRYATH